ncbi:MAG: serine protease AprX [Actinomycetota bacterium]|jgi:serine protease AprX|nr:serine protease AprX [Actinomycetota bacterium]
MTATTRRIDQRIFISLALAATLLLSLAGSPQAAQELSRRVSVIVQGWTTSDARDAVRSVGGRETQDLSIIDGVLANVPADRLDELSSQAGVRSITRDGRVDFNATGDDYSLSSQRIGNLTNSKSLWDEGVTGAGVGVAVLDTGVYAAHPDLAGRVTHCEDFSQERGTAAECADTFGHGTFMAGLIAGDGTSSGGAHTGAAPDANIIAVKLAGFDGAADVSNVLAGIQWVVANRGAYNIRVLNMSLGTDSSQSYLLSPLNYAVQKAWKSGIVVVVSAGNSGPDSRTVLKPADDPYVITVGASDDEGTLNVSDDTVPVFSSRGPTRSNGLAKPDVVAPGVHTVSLRSPGSAIDQAFGATAMVGDSYFRGTGTSMSAAVVSGVVAQMLQAKPTLVPDQVKYRLMNTTRRITTTDPNAAGKGLIDAYAAARSTSTAKANQGLLLGLGTGLGSIQADRGGLQIDVLTPTGMLGLTGEKKAQYNGGLISLSNPLGLLPWVGLTYTAAGWDPLSYALTSWVNDPWAATKWRATKWRETGWDATKWRGSEWYNADWDATKWRGTDWSATKWRATSFQSAWYAAGWE